MFPQYCSLKENPWNLCELSDRAHYIAHIILWKAFPNKQSVLYSAYRMQFKYNNSKKYSSLRESFKKRASINTTLQHNNMDVDQKKKRSEKISNRSKGHVMAVNIDGNCVKIKKEIFDDNKDIVGITKGRTTVKDSKGNTFMVHVTDERLISGELVGVQRGVEHSAELKEHLSNVRKGVPKTEEWKQSMRVPKKRIECAHCGQLIPNNKIKAHLLKCH